jgi:putative ABC transport system substrate-binding protein
VSDPVRFGLAASLRRPGGNITGLSDAAGTQLSPKRLELLKEVCPTVSRIAVIHRTQQRPFAEFFETLVAAANRLRVTLIPTPLDEEKQLEATFAVVTRERADGIIVLLSPVIWASLGGIAQLAERRRLPAIYGFLEAVPAGGLMAYGVDNAEMWYRGGEYVDRILRGANPGDLPIGQPLKFEFAINAKTARGLGITIPPAVLVRADRVIE